MAAEMRDTGLGKRMVLSLWLGLLTLLWACQPLLISQARGIVVLALFAGVLAGLGGLTGVQLLVVWSGGVGVLNLTLALLLTASPPHLWVGLSAGLTLLALLDGNQCVAYLRHCQIGPGVLVQIFRHLVRLSAWSVAAGVSVGYLVTALYAPHMRYRGSRVYDHSGGRGLCGLLCGLLTYFEPLVGA